MALINMENKTQIGIIVVAIMLGVGASGLVGTYVTSKVNEETKKIAYQYDKAQAQKEQMYNEQMALLNQKINEVEGRAKQAAEEAAKAAAQQKVAPVTEVKKKPSLALRTPAGKRALTVQIESLGVVGGLVNPGDFVDVIASLDMPTGKKLDPKEKVTAMIFQNLQVLAVNTNIDEPGAYDAQQKENTLKVTFAVEPQEAGLLAFAEQNGKLNLALRTPSEKGRTMIPTANWSTLAEYVLENSGADIKIEGADKKKVADLKVETENVDEAKPYIQIYRGGREL
ncbi:MAG: Flp pilus assembly protein CpaB [Candidatus Omnitrophica bacterium]|nr:Flp pilus assembly protein CpaB [Candidatus Omnitrophota bacterium]